MTTPLFRDDAYLREASGTVAALTSEGGVVLDASLFYPTGGGQPGDAGWLFWEGGEIEIVEGLGLEELGQGERNGVPDGDAFVGDHFGEGGREKGVAVGGDDGGGTD